MSNPKKLDRIIFFIIIVSLCTSMIPLSNAYIGDLNPSLVDSLEWDTSRGQTPDMCRVNQSDYYIVVSCSLSSPRVTANTFHVDPGTGDITAVDSIQIETSTSAAGYPGVSWLPGTHTYVVSYFYSTASKTIKAATINVSAVDGLIQDTVVDKLTLSTATLFPTTAPYTSIINITNNIFAVSWVNNVSNDGTKRVQLTTCYVNAHGMIGDTVNDTQEVHNCGTSSGNTPYNKMAKIDADTIAIAYTGASNYEHLDTYNISATGAITNTPSSSWTYQSANGFSPFIAPLTGSLYALIYRASTGKLILSTVSIAASGLITKTLLFNMTVSSLTGSYPYMSPKITDNSLGDIYAVTYQNGSRKNGTVATITINSTGYGRMISSMVYNRTAGWYAPIRWVSGDYYLIASAGNDSAGAPWTTYDGWLYTVNISTTTIDLYPKDGATGLPLDFNLSAYITYPDGTFSYSIECDGYSASGSGESDGYKILDLWSLDYNTSYTAYINVTRGATTSYYTDSFTTIKEENSSLLSLINQGKSIMVFQAHPDDEFMYPGILAYAKSQGCSIRLICCKNVSQSLTGNNSWQRPIRQAAIDWLNHSCLIQYLQLGITDGSENWTKIRENFTTQIALRNPEILLTYSPDGYVGGSNPTAGHNGVSNAIIQIVENMTVRPYLFFFINTGQDLTPEEGPIESLEYPPTDIISTDFYSPHFGKTLWDHKIEQWMRYSQSMGSTTLEALLANSTAMNGNDRKEYFYNYTSSGIITLDASGIEETNATLNGQIIYNSSVEYGFDYGTSTNYSSSITVGNVTDPDNYYISIGNCSPTNGDRYQVLLSGSNSWANTFDGINATYGELNVQHGAHWGRYNFSTNKLIDKAFFYGWVNHDSDNSKFNITQINVTSGNGTWFTAWTGELTWYRIDPASWKNATFSRIYNVSQMRIKLDCTWLHSRYYEIFLRNWTQMPPAGTIDYSYNLTGLNPGQIYYFHAWANNSYETTYGLDKFFITKPQAPSSLANTAAHENSIELSWTTGSGANTTKIQRKPNGYPGYNYDGSTAFNNTGNTTTDTGLTAGKYYYYRAWSYTAWGTDHEYSDGYSSLVTMTRPGEPMNVTIIPHNATAEYISWIPGTNSNRTLVISNNDHVPTSMTDGTTVYNDTSNNTYVTITSSKAYYFKAWAWTHFTAPHLSSFSENGTGATWGFICIGAFNESKPSQAANPFTVFITNPEGTIVYTASGCTNYKQINVSLLPVGNAQIIINASHYYPRNYYVYINQSICFLLNAYLPPKTYPGVGNKSILCVVSVIDTGGNPVADALITVRHYINTTGIFENVSSLMTDGYGQAQVYLHPDDLYKFIIEKEHYDRLIGDWTPTTIIYTHTFQLTYETPEIQPTQYPDEYVFFKSLSNRSNSTLYLHYQDTLNETIDAQIYVYEINTSTGNTTLIYTDLTSGQSEIYLNITGLNATNSYTVILNYNHTQFGSQGLTALFEGWHTTITTSAHVNLILSAIFQNGFMFLSHFIMFCLALALFYWIDSEHVGIGLIIIGGLFLFINIYLGIDNALAVAAGGTIPGLLIFVGIIKEIIKKGKGATA